MTLKPGSFFPLGIVELLSGPSPDCAVKENFILGQEEEKWEVTQTNLSTHQGLGGRR